MDWWGWLTWGVTALIALGGLLLGIRAELRAGYRKRWTVTSGVNNRFINRTGEEATDVEVEAISGWIGAGSSQQSHVDIDEEFVLTLCSDTGGEVKYRIIWTRPSTGRTYEHVGTLSRSWKPTP